MGGVPERDAPTGSAEAPGALPAVAVDGVGEARQGPAVPWWLLVLVLPMLAALVWWGHQRSGLQSAAVAPAVQPRSDPVAVPAAAPPAVPAEPSPPRLLPARLSLGNIDGKVVYAGALGPEEERAALIAVLQEVFGLDNMAGEVRIDPQIQPAPWLGELEAALRKHLPPRAEMQFDGSSVRIGGLLEADEQHRMRTGLQELYGTAIGVTVMTGRADAQFRDAKARTLSALSALPADFAADDLAAALNLAIIDFETGSVRPSTESRELLRRMAEVIRVAPAGTMIEIGGHTDDLGDAAANLVLSQERAEAVRGELVALGVGADKLRAHGYGEERPVAANETLEGRSQNRRITFAVFE